MSRRLKHILHATHDAQVIAALQPHDRQVDESALALAQKAGCMALHVLSKFDDFFDPVARLLGDPWQVIQNLIYSRDRNASLTGDLRDGHPPLPMSFDCHSFLLA